MPRLPDSPPMRPEAKSSFPSPEKQPRRRRHFFLTQTTTFVALANLAEIDMRAGGASGAAAISATDAGSAGGAGQVARGVIRLEKGSTYVYTHGTGGAVANATFGAATEGIDGGDGTLVGPGVNIVLKGGKKGLIAGTASGAVGVPASSPVVAVIDGFHSLTIYPGVSGGTSVTSGLGTAGGDSPDGAFSGGAAGVGSPSGPGGGSTPGGRGGAGGSSMANGNAPSVDYTGAGGGAAGAGGGSVGQISGKGADGSLRLVWDV